ncbi:MAG: hypothetical protein WC337_04195 [Candidatus Muiribacteriota bacterium]
MKALGRMLIFVVVSILVFTVNAQGLISREELSDREHFAADIISMDEDFLGDYVGVVDDDELYHFFELAIKMAVEVASETKNIENNEEAYVYIVNRIDGQGGVKDQVMDIFEQYLSGEYVIENNTRNFTRAQVSTFDIRNFEHHMVRIEINVAKIALQKSLF